MEDAISQLQDLGVTRGQAKKALARYNNDVARAADFIFSGNPISDDEAEENPTESDEALALRLNAEEEAAAAAAAKVYSESNSFKETIPETVISKQPEPAKIIHQNTEIVPPDNSDSWSVVPFQSTTNTRPVTPRANISNESSLTWWKDPEDPTERMALDDIPIGLRPPSYNFAYSPILLQALFHVTAFRYAVLSFRPTPCSWGAPENYWKGFGEPVPNYITREVITKREVVTRRPSSPKPPSKDVDLISFEDSSKENTEEEESDDINEGIIDADLPPQIIETPIEETVEYVEFVDNELQLMPKCLQTLSEMQKIFAFLGNSKRLYGSVSHYVRALNTKLATNNWEFSDKTFDAFLDMVIQGLVQADEHADNAVDPLYIPIFRRLFLVKARIEDGNEYDDEEVDYLTLNVDKNMCSFHDCLDPLVFESNQVVDDEADPSISSDGEDEPSFKFTTFKQIPPILMVALDNRSFDKKTGVKYMIEKKIYMDRYMIEKRDQALEGFKEMDICRQEINNSKAEIEKLKSDNTLGMDRRDVLIQTLDYFEQKQQDEGDEEGLESLKYVLNSVKQKIEARLVDLENVILDQKDKMHQIFDSDNMKGNGYDLRASFHHDGKDGTGHYWAYIWVEPTESNLLQDISSEGGWFKFCDAYVTASSETELYSDPFPPFALMYVNETIPKYTRDQLHECIPESLKEFILADNTLFNQEIHANDHTSEQGNASLIFNLDDDTEFTEKQESTNFIDMESSSATFDDNVSVGTAVGHMTIEDSEPQQYSFTGQSFGKLKERVNTKISQAIGFDSDDYRLLMSFENFLARTQNQLLLEHLYLLYSSEELVDEEASKQDDDLKIIWHEYETFLVIAEMVTRALSYFVDMDFSNALQSLLDAKRHEASWKHSILLDLDISSTYSGLDTISFNNIIETYGKECLKVLNEAAYKKASNESYRTRGLEDAIRIAYQAQTIIGPDNIQNDQIYQSLGELWLSFTEQQIVGSLTDTQVELLNTLVMTYLEGQGGGSVGIPSRSESPVKQSDDDERDHHLPLWQKYQQVCSRSEQLLTNFSNK